MLFLKKIKTKSTEANRLQQRIWNKWKSIKEISAVYLQQKSEKLSVQNKKYSLIFFCLLFGGSSTAIIIHSFTKESAAAIIKIAIPAHLVENDKWQVDSAITKDEYDRVEEYKNFLIRLNTDSSGQRKFDSIQHARPQLLDSIHLFEKMYLHQK